MPGIQHMSVFWASFHSANGFPAAAEGAAPSSIMPVDRTTLDSGDCFPRIFFQESGYNMTECFIENEDQLC